jgi:ATP-dependent phosphofructokinase / diphosphate-dependent phosphofructokinase
MLQIGCILQENHQCVMIFEVMGRDAGWIALEAGIASRAHATLIPEIPYQLEKFWKNSFAKRRRESF